MRRSASQNAFSGPDFDWIARFDQAISKVFPGPEVPRVYDDHIYLWVDKTKPQLEIERVYPCIEQANNDYRILGERREKREKRQEESRKRAEEELSAINDRLRGS